MLVFTAGVAEAQRRGFGGVNTLRVAAVPEVATELKFNAEQTALAKKLDTEDRKQRTEFFQSFQDLTQAERREKFQQYSKQQTEKTQELTKAIGAEKAKRLRQFALQAYGLGNVARSQRIARQLSLTEDQRESINEARRGIRQQLRDAGNDAEARAQVQQGYDEKIAALLTDEQKNKWQELVGKPAGAELLAKIREATRFRRRRSTN